MRAEIRRELLRRIVDGTYPAGQRLVELHIAREFNTSQAPVREALRELEALRLVETETYRGTRVRGISDREIRETMRVRGVLECEAAYAAAGVLRGMVASLRAGCEAIDAAARSRDFEAYARHNTVFHRTIVAASGNEVLLRVWDSLIFEARTQIALRSLDNLDLVAVSASHVPIVDALDAGDGELAGRLLLHHAEFLGTIREPVQPAAELVPPVRCENPPSC